MLESFYPFIRCPTEKLKISQHSPKKMVTNCHQPKITFSSSTNEAQAATVLIRSGSSLFFKDTVKDRPDVNLVIRKTLAYSHLLLITERQWSDEAKNFWSWQVPKIASHLTASLRLEYIKALLPYIGISIPCLWQPQCPRHLPNTDL